MPVGLATNPDPDPDAQQAFYGSAPISNWAGVQNTFASAADPTPALHFLGDLWDQNRDAYAREDQGLAGAPSATPRLTPEQANQKYGLEGALRFNAPVTENDAAFQSYQAHQAQLQSEIFSHSHPNPLLTFGAGVAGSLINPSNLPIMLATGGLGDAALGALGVVRAGEAGAAITNLGRVANVARSLGEGAINNLGVVGQNAFLSNYDGDDYTLGDGLRDIAAGAIFHTGVHYLGLGLNAAGERLRGAPGAASDLAAVPEPGAETAASGAPSAPYMPEAVQDLPLTERTGAFVKALDDMAADRPVDVGQYVDRALNPPDLTNLDEATAAPDVPSWRPLPDAEPASAITTRGSEVPVQYGLAELGDLTTSHDDNLNVNPDYPPELQPRDRARAGAQARNYQLESELNPKLLMQDIGAGSGAPIVSPDGIVESGNGRTIALRRSASKGGAAYDRYTAELKAQGFDTTGMDKPVLVRMRTEAMDGPARAALAREMNADVTERMSATEQAMSDARRIDPASYAAIPEGRSPVSSREFARSFIDRVAPDQANTLAGVDGALSPEGARRIKAAVLAHAYGDPRLVGQIFEDEAAPTRKLGEALAGAAPAWSALRAAVARGEVPAELDLTAALRSAMDLARYAKDSGTPLGELIADRLGQHELFGGETISPQTEAFLRLMFRDEAFEKPAPPDKIAWALKDYARQAMAVEPGENLFGETPDVDTARQILSLIADRFARGDAGDIDLRAPGRSDGPGGVLAEPFKPSTPVIDLREPGQDGDRPGRGVSPEGERGAAGGDRQPGEPGRPDEPGPAGGERDGENQGDGASGGAQSIIAADPELKALAADTEALAKSAGLELPAVPDNENPDTLAKAVKAAAVCLADASEEVFG